MRHKVLFSYIQHHSSVTKTNFITLVVSLPEKRTYIESFSFLTVKVI